MHLGIRESVALTRGVLRSLRGKEYTPEVVLCPSFTALSEVHKALARSRVRLGAQNVGVDRSGAYTGEVSPGMLEDVGCKYVLVGHSERREQFGDTDEMVSRRLDAVLDSKLTPVLCVGESKEVRDAGDAQSFVSEQLTSALQGRSWPRKKPLVIAYEPIWAIGSGQTISVGDAIEMHTHIRTIASDLTTVPEEDIAVLYGGSVDDDNAYSFLRENEIGGVLVGGASLKIRQFQEILEAAIDVIVAQEV